MFCTSCTALPPGNRYSTEAATLYSENPRDFEQRVAAIFRVSGARTVSLEKALAGTRIDVYVEEDGRDGHLVRTAYECKAYAQPVGGDTVASCAGLATLLKQRDLIDHFAVVSASGFTKGATLLARESRISLYALDDLESRVAAKKPQLSSVIADLRVEYAVETAAPSRPKRAFVIMPFAQEFEDVYILGIREVAEKLGLVVERADDIEHNENIMSIVLAGIREADLIIGETTSRNANCFYEIGYAHAVGRPTILIGRKGQEVPFDLRAMNLVFYSSIVELRDLLAKRINATLS